MSSVSRTDNSGGMGAGAFVSALLHGSVIVLTLIAWPRLLPDSLPDQVVPVELLPPSEETNIMAQSKAEKPIEEPKPEPTPPPPAPAAAEPPPPPPMPDEMAMPDPVMPPIPKEPEAKPQPATPRFAHLQPQRKPKPEKAKPSFDDMLKNLKVAPSQEQKPTEPVKPNTTAQSTRTTTGVGAQTAMTMSEIDALRSQMMKCWNVPVGAPDPRALVLSLKIQLNQDGSVAGMPQLVETQGLGDPYFRAASESAIRAVKMCAPYSLPAEKYETWSNLTVVFDPSKAAGF